MSYRQLVEPHHRQAYSDNVQMAAQMMTNPLSDTVTVMPVSGEAKSMDDLVGEVDYLEGEDCEQRNPQNPPPLSRRWLVRPTSILSGQLITKEEVFDQIKDPKSKLVMAHTKAVMRGHYDRLLGIRKKAGGSYEIAGGGILGKVYNGKTPESQTSLPAGNFIAVDADAPGTPSGLGLIKLRAATEAMELEDFGLETDQDVFGLITPKQKTDLIKLAIETGKNLNPFDVKQIEEGKPGRLLGVNWRFSNRVPVDADGYRLIPLWTKENIIAGEWQGIEGDVFNNPERKNQPQVLVDAYVAAGRYQDGGVRVIRCAEV